MKLLKCYYRIGAWTHAILFNFWNEHAVAQEYMNDIPLKKKRSADLFAFERCVKYLTLKCDFVF